MLCLHGSLTETCGRRGACVPFKNPGVLKSHGGKDEPMDLSTTTH
jgi:hypothetical protein